MQKNSKIKIGIVGIGYVGLSNGLLLSQKNKVVTLDIDKSKVDMLNSKKLPIDDKHMQEFLISEDVDITATLDKKACYKDAKFILIATPTDYDEKANTLNTSIIDSVIGDIISINPLATIIIKSTIPYGFTEKTKKKFNFNKIFFSPEFLREGSALYDNLNPSRIILGENSDSSREFANLLEESATKENIPIFYTGNSEAEAIKLFANTYLAMRVSFFNELDSFALNNNINSKQIIDGISSDDRIGNHYNNPSFGYGGYCLPKDTKQLLANYSDTPQTLISAIVSSNESRKDLIFETIKNLNPQIIGVYRLIMKSSSDNFRDSSIIDVIKKLQFEGFKIIIFEPNIKKESWESFDLEKDLNIFKDSCDLIIANRIFEDIKDVSSKVFTRDLFGNN
tara:strand:+ start:3451 stop:4635 length:1185 start_codon:yes stop_codon:yes gene_type:complete